MPRLFTTFRCDHCDISLHAPGRVHWEDLRLLALDHGWELDGAYGDLCPDCSLGGTGGVFLEGGLGAIGYDIPPELGPRVYVNQPFAGQQINLNLPTFEGIATVIATAALLLARRRL